VQQLHAGADRPFALNYPLSARGYHVQVAVDESEEASHVSGIRVRMSIRSKL
jgi:hypothetical protein